MSTHTTQHTPGPWALNAGNLCEIDTKAHAIAHVYGTASCEPEVASECRANARLIAASPELLATLRDALIAMTHARTVHGLPDCFLPTIAAARAAIARATSQA